MGDNATTTVLTTIEPGGNPPLSDDGATAANADTIDTPAEGTEGVKPPPPPAEPEPDPKLKVAEKLSAASKREQRARQAELELKKRHEDFGKREADFTKKQADLQKMIEDFETDPVAYLLAKGKDPVEAVKRFTKPQTPEEKRIAALEAEREAEKKQAKEREEQETKQRQARHERQQVLAFIREITPEEQPFLTTLHPDAEDVPNLVKGLLSEKDEDGMTLLQSFRAEHQRNPTNREIRGALEYRAKERAMGIFEALKKLFEPASPQPASGSDDANTREPPSLSNQHAGKTITARSEVRPLTLEEKRKKNGAAFRAQVEAEQRESE